jgi:hypothetical protein
MPDERKQMVILVNCSINSEDNFARLVTELQNSPEMGSSRGH